MIVVRDVFELHFGKATEATRLFERARKPLAEAGYEIDRLLVDVTGPYYTLVMESRHESLASYEDATRRAGESDAWKAIYSEIVPLVRVGRREVFREVES